MLEVFRFVDIDHSVVIDPSPRNQQSNNDVCNKHVFFAGIFMLIRTRAENTRTVLKGLRKVQI